MSQNSKIFKLMIIKFCEMCYMGASSPTLWSMGLWIPFSLTRNSSRWTEENSVVEAGVIPTEILKQAPPEVSDSFPVTSFLCHQVVIQLQLHREFWRISSFPKRARAMHTVFPKSFINWCEMRPRGESDVDETSDLTFEGRKPKCAETLISVD